MKRFLMTAGLMLAAASATTAFAAKDADAPSATCVGLKIATGPVGKGYSKIFQDIDKACGRIVPVCEVPTTGGLDNLSSLSQKDADIGLSQVDTWVAMKNGDENVGALQGLMGLNSNYLHVVVAAAGYTVEGEKKYAGLVKGDSRQVVIQRFSELRGKRVALVGSAQLLGRQLNKSLNYNMELVDVGEDAAAFSMVAKGQVAAALSLSGWPSGSLKNLKQDSGLSLVPFDAPSTAPYIVKPINYKGLGVYNSNALAVENVMFTRPFKGDKAGDVSRLKACIADKLQDMQEGEYEPAWNEVKSLDNMPADVPRFKTVAVAGTTGGAVAPKSKKK